LAQKKWAGWGHTQKFGKRGREVLKANKKQVKYFCKKSENNYHSGVRMQTELHNEARPPAVSSCRASL